MKRLILLLIVLSITLSSISQIFVPRTNGTFTPVDPYLSVSRAFYLPKVCDTLVNPLKGGKDSVGAMIFDTCNHKVWIRDVVGDQKYWKSIGEGVSGVVLNNIGTGFAWVATPSGDIKRVANGYGVIWDSTNTANSLTAKADTSVLATQFDISGFTSGGAATNQLTYWASATTIGGDAGMTVDPTANMLLFDTLRLSKKLKFAGNLEDIVSANRGAIQFGGMGSDYFRDFDGGAATGGYLWRVYPKFSCDTCQNNQPFYASVGTSVYDEMQPANSVLDFVALGDGSTEKPLLRLAVEQNFNNTWEIHLPEFKPRNSTTRIRNISMAGNWDNGASQVIYRFDQQYTTNSLGTYEYASMSPTSAIFVPYSSTGIATLRMTVQDSATNRIMAGFNITGQHSGAIDLNTTSFYGHQIEHYYQSAPVCYAADPGGNAFGRNYIFSIADTNSGSVAWLGKGWGGSFSQALEITPALNSQFTPVNTTDNGYKVQVEQASGLYVKGKTRLDGVTAPISTYNVLVHGLTDSVVYQVPASIFSGISTLNTLTAATQTFAVGTSGTDFNISSATSTHTFNIPSASTANRGLVTTASQTFGGAKTFNDGAIVTFPSAGSGSSLVVSGDRSLSAAPGVSGIGMQLATFTYTNNSGAGTETGAQNFHLVGQPTLTSGNAISYTGDVSTVRFVGAPIAAGSTTAAKVYNIFANDNSYFEGIAGGLNETASDITLGDGLIQHYTGTGGTWTLPTLANAPGRIYMVKNMGSGNLTVQRGGSDNIFDASSVTSVVLAVGDARMFIGGGSFWAIH